MRGRHTLREILRSDGVVLLYFLHDELLLVHADDDGGAARIPAGEAELAEGVLEYLRDVDGAGLGQSAFTSCGGRRGAAQG